MTFFANFKRSALELKNLQCLCITSILIALDLVLKQVTFSVSTDLKVSVAFLALASIGMLYGPTVGFLSGVVTDLLGILIKNTGAFNPMFTLVEATGAMLYGVFLYNLRFTDAKALNGKFTNKNDLKMLLRIVFAKVSVVVVCNLILTPLALIVSNSMEAGTFVYAPTLARYPARLIKNAIQTPVDIIMLMGVLPIISKAYNIVFGKMRRSNAQ